MKDKKWKWMKHNWAVVCFAIAVILLAVSGSLAAYTSFNSVKRVVSTGGKKSDTMFSSNYLSLVDWTDTQYAVRYISPSEVRDTAENNVEGYTFTVQICNYILGNPAVYNLNDIEYTFTVNLLPSSGSSLPEGITEIKIGGRPLGESGSYTLSNEKLAKGSAQKKEYAFYVPVALKDLVKFQIVAEPVEASVSATNHQKLAGVITLSSLAPTENWTGQFLDDKNEKTDDYDAFNYEISGNGEGTVTLSWPENLQISSWFLTDVNTTPSGNSCTFSVGGSYDNGTPRPEAYHLQFYRTPGKENLDWSEMESMVSVSFSSSPGSAG